MSVQAIEPMEDGPTRYGAAGRNGEIGQLLAVAGPMSARKEALGRSSYKIGQLVGGRHLDYENAEDALWSAARVLGIPGDDCRKIIDKGLRQGMDKPRQPRRIKPAFALSLIELAEERYDFSGRTGATDRAVYCAFVRVATRLGSLDFYHSMRQLGEEAGLGAIATATKGGLTVSKSCARLAAGGLLRQRWKGRGRVSSLWYLTPHGGLLRMPVASPVALGTPLCRNPPQPSASGVPNATDLEHHVVWDRRAFGPTRKRIYAELVGNALTTSELATILGLHRGTVHRAMVMLDEHYMVRRLVDHWIATWRPLDDVAADMGVLDLAERRKQAHRQQRESYRDYLLMRKAGADPKKKVAPLLPVADPETGEILRRLSGGRCSS